MDGIYSDVIRNRQSDVRQTWRRVTSVGRRRCTRGLGTFSVAVYMQNTRTKLYKLRVSLSSPLSLFKASKKFITKIKKSTSLRSNKIPSDYTIQFHISQLTTLNF